MNDLKDCGICDVESDFLTGAGEKLYFLHIRITNSVIAWKSCNNRLTIEDHWDSREEGIQTQFLFPCPSYLVL